MSTWRVRKQSASVYGGAGLVSFAGAMHLNACHLSPARLLASLLTLQVLCLLLTGTGHAHPLHPVVPHPAEGVTGQKSNIAEYCPPCNRARKSSKKKWSQILQAVCEKDYALGVRVVDLQPRHYIVEVFAVFRITGVPLYFQGAPLADEHADGGTHVRSSGRHVSLHRGDSSYLTLNRPYSLSSHCSCPHLHVNKPYLIAGSVNLERQALALTQDDFSRRWNNRTMNDVAIGMRLCRVYQSSRIGTVPK